MKKLLLLLVCLATFQVSNAQYCSAGPSSTADSNVTAVVLTGETQSINYSGCPAITGVNDQTAVYTADVVGDISYSVDITFGTCGSSYSGAGEAWIDWNSNQTFESSESIGSWSGAPTSLQTFTFTVPLTALNGTTRLRVMQRESGSLPLDPCGSYSWGSVDDFSIDISGAFTPSCSFPSSLAASGVTATTVDLAWTAGDSETLWDIELVDVTASGSATGTPTTEDVTTNPYTLTGLTAQNNYQVYLRADCGGGDTSDWVGPVSFTTLCEAYSLPFSEGMDNTGSTPDCWTLSGAENWRFSTSGAGNHIGSNGTINGSSSSGGYFAWVDSSGSEANAILTSPSVDISSLTTPLLTFYELSDNEGGSNSLLTVEVYDGAAWNTVRSFDTNTLNNAWEQKDVSLDGLTFTGNAQVRFTFTETTTGYVDDIAIDDVSFVETPLCSNPSTAMSAITATGATATWAAANGAASYDWEVVPTGNAQGTGVVASGSGETGLTVSITGLTALTTYDFLISSDCTTDYASAVTFTTSVAPYVGCGDTDYDTGGPSGNYSNNEDYTITYTPDTPGDIVTIDIDYVQIETNWDKLSVYDGADITATQLSAQVTADVSFTASSGNGITIRFTSDGSGTYAGYSLTSSCAAPPSCQDASATMSNITATGATATWDAANGAASYDWEVVPTGNAQGTGVVASGTGETGLSVSITGLTSNTAYDFYISSDCTTDYASAVTFTTICDTITSFALDFDSSTNIPDCTSIDVSNIQLGGLSIETIQSVSGTNSLRHRSYYLGDSSDFISQYVSTLGSNYRLNLSYWNNSNSDATLSVGTSDEAGNFTLFEDVTITETFQWVSLSVDFSAYTGTDTRITLRNTTNAAGEAGFYVDYFMDDIVWEVIPSCLAVSDITYTSADTDGTSSLVSWTENGTATNYNIEVYAAGADTSTATAVYTEAVAGATSTTVTGLTAHTYYDAYVQADCGFSGTAAFVMQEIYTGYCNPSAPTTNVVYINDVTTTGGTTNISNTASGFSTDGFGDFRDQSITGVYGSQSFDVSVTYDGQYGGRTHYWVDWNNNLEFDNTAGSSEFIGTSANGLTGTITVTIPANQAAGDYVLRIRLFNDTAAGADPCVGSMVGETEDYTISVIETPDCLVPDTLASANITGVSADLSWNETGSATSHVVYVYDTGADPTTATPAYTDTVSGTTTDTATGLTGNTTYDFYIAAVCPQGLGTTLSDLQTVPGTFTTSCEAITTPYTEDFETFTPATDTAFLVENCWLGTDSTFYWEMAAGTDTGSGTTGPSPTITTGNYFYTEATVGAEGDIAELSTTINLAGLTNPELTFDYHMYGATTGTLDVIVGGTNVFTLTGQQQTSDTADWITAIVDLSAYSGENSVIFRATRGLDYRGDISLDNVSFAEAPACAEPTSLSASAQQTSVDLAWIAGDTETIWDIELVDVTAGGSATGTPTTEDITTNPYTLSGLTSSNDYDVYLRADCSGDNSETSDWLSVSFTTLPGCGDTVSFCYAGGLVKHTELESLGDLVTVTVNSGSTESGYDNLVIFDSLDTSGNILYNTYGDHTGESVTSTTGLISVWTNADGSWDCDDGLAGSVIEVTFSCVSPCNWTGATSSDWADVSNWSTGAVPTSSDIVVIDGTFTNEPLISSSTDAAAISVAVATGNTLTIDETSSLTVSGDFTNSGTVTLNSTADDFSSLIVTGTASGDIVYNRYVNVYDDTAGGGWDLVCSPVDMSIADFITANGSNIEVLGDNFAFAQFNNASGQWERYATDNSDTGSFTSGQGYSMATTAGATVAFTGAMQTTDQSINIINNDGLNNVGRRWNLVSNPFPSYIAGNTAAATTNFMDANSAVIDSEFLAVYGWNGSDYTIYNQLSGAFSMAPGQGFWVAAAGTSDAALDFTAAMRTTTGTGDFVSGPQLLTYNVGLKLYNGEIERAATNFYFRDGLTLGLDPGYDAAAYNQSTKLSTRLAGGSQETAFAINAMDIDDLQNTRVPLEIRQNAGQAFTISISDMDLPEDIYVYLEDTLNGTLTSLKDGDFELTAQSNLSGSDRFFIVFKSNSVLSNGDTLGINAINVYKANTDSFVTIAGISPELGKLNVSLYNILGQTVREKALSSATATQTISTDALASGLYIVQIRSGNQVFIKKIIVE